MSAHRYTGSVPLFSPHHQALSLGVQRKPAQTRRGGGDAVADWSRTNDDDDYVPT